MFVADAVDHSSSQVSKVPSSPLCAASVIKRPSIGPFTPNLMFAILKSSTLCTGQERYLFSWRLLFIDAVLMMYLFCIFVASLALSIDVTRAVVINAILK